MGFCDNANGCGVSCTTDDDCPFYSACTSGHPECNGGNVCLDFSGCGSAKMMMAIRGMTIDRRGELLRGTNVNGTES